MQACIHEVAGCPDARAQLAEAISRDLKQKPLAAYKLGYMRLSW